MSKRNVTAICGYCDCPFLTWTWAIKRGQGKFCSLSCASKGKEMDRDYSGHKNPNWKGGVSKNRKGRYAYKLLDMKRHPEKHAARQMVQQAIRSGRLIRGNCEKCNQPQAHAHHDDYMRPLDVRWLCRPHHTEHHRQAA